MTWFSARNVSASTVPVPVADIWQHLTDPGTLADLTPLIHSIEEVDDRWRWKLHGIEGLGVGIEAVFTERMDFTEQRQIVFTHDPPEDVRERAAVEGVYDLEPSGDATDLHIDLTLSVDLPLPSLTRPAVETIMLTTMRTTGKRFAANLYGLLGLDPATVDVNELNPP